MIDNTTALAVANDMGTSHSDTLNKLGKKIGLWCIARNIWISAGHMYRNSYERECISGLMSTSDALKVLKIARAIVECNFENFENITSDHKSRNTQASSYDFLFIIYSTKLLSRGRLRL